MNFRTLICSSAIVLIASVPAVGSLRVFVVDDNKKATRADVLITGEFCCDGKAYHKVERGETTLESRTDSPRQFYESVQAWPANIEITVSATAEAPRREGTLKPFPYDATKSNEVTVEVRPPPYRRSPRVRIQKIGLNSDETEESSQLFDRDIPYGVSWWTQMPVIRRVAGKADTACSAPGAERLVCECVWTQVSAPVCCCLCWLCSQSSEYNVEADFGDARLTVSVPPDAILIINGKRTSKTGDRRDFVSRGLKQGLAYRYIVRAEVTRDGKTIEETKEIILRPNDKKQLTFDLSDADAAHLAAAR